tara:strand:+ start:415 stop:624 length:210 start_codon:yes stop_codon:yes gene_type:complete
MINNREGWWCERKETYTKQDNGTIKLQISVDYGNMQNKRITEGTVVYYERCSWSMAFDNIEDNQLNNRL